MRNRLLFKIVIYIMIASMLFFTLLFTVNVFI